MMQRPKKSLGQNFLMHQQTADRIAGYADVPKGEVVLEIGPGTGKLTRALLARGLPVIAIEKDPDLIPVLKQSFEKELQSGQLVLQEQDIRQLDLETLPTPYHLVANIPYYITGDIIRMFLSAKHKPRTMTLLVQKEVAERVARSKKESLLSLSVKAYGTPRYMSTVPKGAFVPKPKVDSAVLRISDIQRDAFATEEEEKRFFDTLHAGFAHKRKLLKGNLTALATPEKVIHAFQTAHIPLKARAEDISLSSWKEIAKNL